MQILSTDVLIVGAGPTGLMAANQLMRFGIDFIIIDSKEGPTHESRAIAVTARSLEIYQQMGLSDQAIQEGKKIIAFNLFSNGRPKAKIHIGEIGEGMSEFSYMLAFEQSKNESLLVQHLQNQEQDVLWNHEFIKLLEYKEKVLALVKHQEEDLQIAAQYVIGAEGARSPIRHQLNFSFKGGTYAQKFFVADSILDWGLDYSKMIVAPGTENFCAFLPLAGERNYRIIGTLPKKYSKKEELSFQEIEDTVINTIGVPLKFEKVNWFSIYKLHHRAVSQFSMQRVFLAGDSAHIHSPAGGQGMNTGLQDAYNLCWKLALVIKGQANERLLETYNEERLPFARWLLKFTDRAFKIMTSTNWFIGMFRKHVMFRVAGFITRNKKIKRRVFKVISQTGYSYSKSSLSHSTTKQKLSFKAGDRLPFFPDENIYPLLDKASFHLLHIAGEPLTDEAIQKTKKLFPFPIQIVEQSLNEKWLKLGLRKELFILLRPDNYISLIVDELNENFIQSYLEKSYI